MHATTLAKNYILNYEFGSTAYTPPATMYFGFSLSVLTDDVNHQYVPTALSFDGSKHVTLTFNNTLEIIPAVWNPIITVEGVNSAFSVTNVDGEWIVTSCTPTTVTFTVSSQPAGTTPQTLTGGLVTWADTDEPNLIGNYSRPSYTNNKTTWSTSTAGILSNAINIVFPKSDLSWGTLKTLFIASNNTTFGGKVWFYEELDPHIPMPEGNTTFTFPPSHILVG